MSLRENCERRGLRCVEELLEKGITEDQLLKAAKILSQSQYSDVVEERNIEHVCGYPLCDATLGPAPKHKYHISVARKQIYDMTERKKFCSDVCFKQSNYFSAQLSPIALWRRTEAIKVKFKLLPSEECSAISNVNIVRPDRPSHTVTTPKSPAQDHRPPLLSTLPKADHIREKCPDPVSTQRTTGTALPVSSTGCVGRERSESSGGEDLFLPPTASQPPTVPLSASQPPTVPLSVLQPPTVPLSASQPPTVPLSASQPPTVPLSASQPPTVPLSASQPSTVPLSVSRTPTVPAVSPQALQGPPTDSSPPQTSTVPPKTPPPPGVQVSKLLSAISTWVSLPLDQLHIRNSDGGRSHDEGKAGGWSHDEGEAGGRSHDEGEAGGRSHDEGEAGGRSHDEGEAGGRSYDEGEAGDGNVFLPPVDSVNVSGIQRNLFNGQLRRHLLHVCSTLDLSFHHVMPHVANTTAKFRLNRKCITFRVTEWRVLAALLIIVSCRDTTDVLTNGNVKKWLEAIKATPQDFKLMLATFRCWQPLDAGNL